MIAIQTARFLKIYIHTGHSIVKKNHELQHGSCTNVDTKSEGRINKIRIRSSNRRLTQQPSLGQESEKTTGFESRFRRIHVYDEQERLYS